MPKRPHDKSSPPRASVSPALRSCSTDRHSLRRKSTRSRALAEHQPAVGRHRRRAGDLHAGRLRARRDRLLPGEARRPRGEHELRHLRPRLRRLLLRRLPARVRRLQLRRLLRPRRARAATAAASARGNWVFLWKGGWATSAAAITPALARRSSSTWSPSWTPWPRSRPARWPSGGSGSSFVCWGLFCGAIYYPLFAAWTWGGGWLAKTWDTMSLGAGYVDFAGSGVVHAVGGVAALAGAIVLGPRIGKFGADGKPRAHPRPPHPDGHARHVHPAVRLVRLQRRLDVRGHRRAVRHRRHQHRHRRRLRCRSSAMFWITKRTGKPDPGMMVNGMLAGLVAITAPCAFVAPWAAAVIGVIAGVLVIEAVFFVERKLKIDDPVGAIAVHGVVRHLRRARRRHLRQRQLRRRLERLATVDGRRRASSRATCGQLGAQALGARRHLDRDLRHRLRFFKIQNKISPRAASAPSRRGRDRRPRHPRDGRRRLPEFVKT